MLQISHFWLQPRIPRGRSLESWQVEQKPGGRGRGKEWATLGEHPLSWLLRNRLEKVPFVSVPHTSSNRLLLSNRDKGCTPSVAHSLALPLGPALLNLWNESILDVLPAWVAKLHWFPVHRRFTSELRLFKNTGTGWSELTVFWTVPCTDTSKHSIYIEI